MGFFADLRSCKSMHGIRDLCVSTSYETGLKVFVKIRVFFLLSSDFVRGCLKTMSMIIPYVSLVGLLRLLNSILSKLLVVRFIRFLLQFFVFTDKMLHNTGKIESLRGVVVVVRWCHCFHVFLHLFLFCCVSVSLQHEKARFLIRFLT